MESTKKSGASKQGIGITALIVDDEQGAINSLRQMLREYCPQVQDIHAAETVKEAITAAGTAQPDLVFLDIEMPPLGSGFDFLNGCPNAQFGVVFTTAYPQYAIRAINAIQPWAYLVKPFSVSELTDAVKIAETKILQQRAWAEQIALRRGLVLHDSRKGNIVLRSKDILFCKAEGSFTAFWVTKNEKIEKIIASGHLGEYEAQLPKSLFCRTHHSFLVNMMYLQRVERTGRNGVAHLTQSDYKVEISVSRMEHVAHHLESFCTTRPA